MNWRYYLILFILSMLILGVVASFQEFPGYMDAEYYFSGGLSLANGRGYTEEFIWNYLDDPSGLPHPSHTYWMPLISILSLVGMKITGTNTFVNARWGFVILAATLPVITAAFSYSMHQRRNLSLFSGLLALFPGFYLPYLTTTDAFGAYMLFGTAVLMVYPSAFKNHTASAGMHKGVFIFGILGLFAGLMHLTRADGLLWFGLIVIFSFFEPEVSGLKPSSIKKTALRNLMSLIGYLLITGPWMWRNYQIFGTLLSPGSSKALWFTDYNDLFAYPADIITPAHWWNSGLGNIVQARLWAFGQNIQTAIAVQGEIFLVPLVLVGLWKMRRDARIILGGVGWLLGFLTMTVVFPFAGARGGFFHAGAATQPMLWALAPVGLEAIIARVGHFRKWKISQAQKIFTIGCIGLAVMISFLTFMNRLVGPNLANPGWNSSGHFYNRLDQRLEELGAKDEDIVMVNNAPGYFMATGRRAISIPKGSLDTVLKVGERYHARYLILEIIQISGQEELIDTPGDRPGLKYLGPCEDARIFEFSDW